jgi:ArsR family transcriptional regulator
VKKKAALFKALGDETRLEIIKLLSVEELCVCEIMDKLRMSQSAVSHHLKILNQAELVDYRREGKWIFYSIKPGAVDLCHDIIDELFSFKNKEQRTVEEKLKKCFYLDKKSR